jgi:multidrug efflux system outer membrane protein
MLSFVHLTSHDLILFQSAVAIFLMTVSFYVERFTHHANVPMRRFRKIIGLIQLAVLSACALGPDYRRPGVTVPDLFRSQDGLAQQASLADLPWWDVFNDPTLRDLVGTALVNNYDLLIAIRRIEESRAVALQARSPLFPQLGYEVDAQHSKNVVLGSPAAAGGIISDRFAGLLNASWELDLWGRIRRADEAARAQILANEEARRGVMLTLVSEVAQAYFELLELDLELDIARRTTASFGESLKMFNQRLEGGVASVLETARAEASQASAASNIPELERQIVVKENQISVLLGRNPEPIPRTATLIEQRPPPEVPAGIPSLLLERRPDIRQAEQQLVAANAQIGVTVAQFFPRVDLTSFFGRVSSDLSQITSGRATTWSIGSSLTGPLFQGGNLLGQYRQARAQWEEVRLRYHQTALNAFQEVSNALIAREKLDQVRAEQERAVRALTDAVRFSTQRYVAGLSSYFEVLDAQQQLYPAENALAQTRLNQLLAIVQLYRALGGGWNLADDQWVGP